MRSSQRSRSPREGREEEETGVSGATAKPEGGREEAEGVRAEEEKRGEEEEKEEEEREAREAAGRVEEREGEDRRVERRNRGARREILSNIGSQMGTVRGEKGEEVRTIYGMIPTCETNIHPKYLTREP